MGIDPSLLHINSTLLDTTFYLPQYPDASVCNDYATKCKVFLELANVTALFPQCNGKIPGTESKKFPAGPQIVNYVVLPLVYKNVSKPVTYSPIYLFSSPNTFSGANDANYVTRCPTGDMQSSICHHWHFVLWITSPLRIHPYGSFDCTR